jgi:hypothetical protein
MSSANPWMVLAASPNAVCACSGRPHAQRGTPAAVGLQPLTTEQTRSSRLNSRPKTVKPVPASGSAHNHCAMCVAPSRSDQRSSTRRCRRGASRESTKDFQTLYATRAGVEGTISQGVRTIGLRRSRYIGQERTHLQHVATAAAINVRSSHPLAGWRPSYQDQTIPLCLTASSGCLTGVTRVRHQ